MPAHKYAERYEFTKRMGGRRKVESVVRNIDAISMIHTCISGIL